MTLKELKGQFYLSDPSGQPNTDLGSGYVSCLDCFLCCSVAVRSLENRLPSLPMHTHVLFLPASPAQVPQRTSEYAASLGTTHAHMETKGADVPPCSVWWKHLKEIQCN